MSKTVNLDRSYPLNFKYPIGVTETITWTNNDIVTLTDVYQIAIAEQDGTIFQLIDETDAQFTKVGNELIWVVDYEHGEIDIRMYDYELRNLTQDYREFNGTIKVTKTIQ